MRTENNIYEVWKRKTTNPHHTNTHLSYYQMKLMTSKLITEGRSVRGFISDSWSGRAPDPTGWCYQAWRWGIWERANMKSSAKGASCCLVQPHCRLWESKLSENPSSCKVPVIHPITFWKTRFLNNHIFTFPCGIQFIWLPTFFETLERFPTGFVENMTLINWGTTVSLALAKNEDEWHDGLKDLTSDQLSQHKVHMTDRDPRVCRWPEHSRQSARAGDNFSSLVRLLNWKLLLRRTYQNMA